MYKDPETKKTGATSFILTAENPEGPWSNPHLIEGAPGIDPDIFFDDDGTVWYIGMHEPKNKAFDGEREIWIQELDVNNFSLKGERHFLWRGACGGVWAEGPHIYKKDNNYYLMIAEGGQVITMLSWLPKATAFKDPIRQTNEIPFLVPDNFPMTIGSTALGMVISSN